MFWNDLEAIYREKIIKAEAENAMDADAEMVKQCWKDAIRRNDKV